MAEPDELVVQAVVGEENDGPGSATHVARALSALLPALPARLLEKLSMLLLPHLLAAFLDDRGQAFVLLR
jgi:hypothetical protein